MGHTSTASSSARKLSAALVAVHRYDNSAFTDQTLKKIGIYTTEECPSWLPQPAPIAQLNLCSDLDHDNADSISQFLQPPEKLPLDDNRTALEWATHFSEIATLLARPTATSSLPSAKSPENVVLSASSARPSPVDWNSPIERLLAKGEPHPDQEGWCWKMRTMLEAHGEGSHPTRSVGCIAFDDSHDPLPQGVPYRRSELLCLLALVCRTVTREPANTRVAATLLMFRSTTLQVLQMRVDPDGPDGARTYITTRGTLPLDKITSEDGYNDWLRVVSWVRFRSAVTHGHRAMPSEDLFSVASQEDGSEEQSVREDVGGSPSSSRHSS